MPDGGTRAPVDNSWGMLGLPTFHGIDVFVYRNMLIASGGESNSRSNIARTFGSDSFHQ